MLLRFKCSNFASIRDEAVLSLEPSGARNHPEPPSAPPGPETILMPDPGPAEIPATASAPLPAPPAPPPEI